jgi:hypothetical protein
MEAMDYYDFSLLTDEELWERYDRNVSRVKQLRSRLGDLPADQAQRAIDEEQRAIQHALRERGIEALMEQEILPLCTCVTLPNGEGRGSFAADEEIPAGSKRCPEQASYLVQHLGKNSIYCCHAHLYWALVMQGPAQVEALA